MIGDLLYRLRALFQRERVDAELEEELRYHQEREAEKLGAPGPRVVMGTESVESVKESCRDERGISFLESTLADLRFAMRQCKKSPVFAAAAILSLAIGIGSNTAIFALLDRVLLRSLPVERPHELVFAQFNRGGEVRSFSYPLYREVAAQQTVLKEICATADVPVRDWVIRDADKVLFGYGRLVTGNYFHVMGSHAAVGRLLENRDDHDGAAGAVVISDRFWEREYARDPRVVGRTLSINQAQLTIVGITPPEFFGEQSGDYPDLWLPMSQLPKIGPSDLLKARYVTAITVLGRTRPDVPRAVAAAALTRIVRASADLTVTTKDGGPLNVVLEDGSRGTPQFARSFRAPLLLLMTMATLVFLAACFNVANLLFARGKSREHEMQIRLSIGAARARLVRQQLTESLLLSLVGATGGMLLAVGTMRILRSFLPKDAPTFVSVTLDWRVVLYSVALAVAATVIAGLAPAFAIIRQGLPALAPGTHRSVTSSRRFTLRMQLLMMAQVAFSVVVLVTGIMFVRSLTQLRSQNLGIQQDHLLMVSLPLELNRSSIGRGSMVRGELLERIRHLPGVSHAAVSCCGPFDSIRYSAPASGDTGAGVGSDDVHVAVVSPDYFPTMGMSLVSGRPLDANDRAGAEDVVVLSETAAKRLFPGTNSIGHRVSQSKSFDPSRTFRVVGVVRDTRFTQPQEQFGSLLFIPLDQMSAPLTSISVRTRPGATGVAANLRRVIRDTMPELAVGRIVSYEEIIESKLQRERVLTVVTVAFSVQVILLVAVGLGGLAQFAGARRRKEMGVRLALGAPAYRVAAMLFTGTLRLVIIGAIPGIAAAVGIGYALRDLLFQVPVVDAKSILAGLGIIGFAGVIATAGPASRAMHLRLVDALREE